MRDFLARRLDPHAAFGLSLTVGIIVILALGWAFGVVAEDVVGREELATADSPVTSWLAERRVDWLTTASRGASMIAGTPVVVAVLVLVAGGALLRGRRWQTGLFLLAVAAGTSALITVVKLLVARTRPDVGYVIGAMEGSAFPSGHSAHAVASYGALAYLLSRTQVHRGAKAAAWAAVALIALAVGFARLYLGAHWLSDVLAGYALGAAWLATLVTATGVHRRLHAR